MNKFFKIFFLVSLTVLFARCSKSNDSSVADVPANDFDVQYATDNALIIDYLKTHKITFDADMNPTYALVPKLDPTSVWGSNNDVHQASLLERTVFSNDKTKSYIIYFLQPRKGSGEQPCNVDQVQCSYDGKLLPVFDIATNQEVYTTFDYTNNYQFKIKLTSAISGWNQIFPQFQGAGSTTVSPDGNLTYSDFGAGIMFLPSGFAYFNRSAGKVPAYAPLIFSFKLLNVARLDQDNDGILSNDEDINKDHYMTLPEDDTDGDGILNFLDVDDDGDNFLTNLEIRRPNLNAAGRYTYYPFNGAAVDDPSTSDIDETQGVPDCSGNFSSPTRLRKYLDKNCH